MGSCLGKNTHNSVGNVHVITSKQEWDEKVSEANENGKIVVANFSASWCGPCKIMTPFYVGLSKKYPSFSFLLIDVDQLTEFSTQWEIHATPTFFFLKDGKQLDKIVGANKTELLKKIMTHVESSTNNASPIFEAN